MMNLDIANLPIIDTHEHLVDESHRVHVEKDVLSLFLSHYISTDLANAGLSIERIQAIRDPGVKIERRWSELEPFWKRVTHTAYAQALKIAVRDLYQIDQINLETIAEIAARVEEASKPGLYSHVFQKAGIQYAVVNDLDGVYDPNALYDTPFPRPSDPPGLFKKVIHGSPLIVLNNKLQILNMQDLLGSHPIHTLQDWLDVITQVFVRADKAVAMKLPYAYNSSLAVNKATYHDAEMVFNQLIGAAYPDESLSHAARQPLTDYLVHYTVQQAAQRGLPIQFHTGLLEGSFNNLQNANPMHLIPLLMEYPEARFVLFHGSYPWIREFIALGKMFPNVWLDMCWVWIISPQAGRLILHEAIETIPQNKITAFGGDYIFVEGSYGHSVMARQNIDRVLSEKIDEGWFGVDEAMQYARAVLYDNALELYGPPE
jgi:uncharacterized protein